VSVVNLDYQKAVSMAVWMADWSAPEEVDKMGY